MAELGNKRRFYLVSGTSTATYTWLEGEQDNSVNYTSNTIEVSDKSTEWQQFISGMRGVTISGTVHTNNTGSGNPQMDFLKALVKGTTVKVFVGVLGSSKTPDNGVVMEAIVSSISDTNSSNAVASRQISLTGTGEPTFYPAIS